MPFKCSRVNELMILINKLVFNVLKVFFELASVLLASFCNVYLATQLWCGVTS